MDIGGINLGIGADWAQIVFGGSILLGGVYAFHRWIKRNIVNPLKEVPELAQNQKETKEQVAAINHTLTVNGNISDPPTILDRIQNLETKQTRIEDRQMFIQEQINTNNNRGSKKAGH